MTSIVVESQSPERTAAMAAALAPLLRAGDVLLLDGDLAAGKTHFVAALTQALGVREPATSPTFAIAQFYAGEAWPILHMDAYRLESLAAFRDLALDEYFATSVVAIEWGAKVAAAFPEHLRIAIDIRGEGRVLTITPQGPRWLAALPALAQTLEAA